MRQEKQNKRRKIIISMGTVLTVLGLIIMLVVGMQSGKLKEIDAELARAMTYEQFEEGEGFVDGTNNCVEFSAFFLRDINGDGYAEKIKGTCKEVGQEDKLYLELNVLTEGHLKDISITVNADNCYFNTAIVKDNYVKTNYIDVNTKKIELNDFENGTQKMLTGNVRTGDYSQKTKMFDAIGKDTTKYSGVNQVILTGTYVAEDGTETPIRKQIDLAVDWYGEAICSIPETYKDGQKNKRQRFYVGEEQKDRTKQSFTVVTQETADKLILGKSYIEGTIPELNGYKPIDVKITGTNVEYTYDEQTGKYTAQRNAEIDEAGNIISNAYTTRWWDNIYNEYKFSLEYPEEAYDAIDISQGHQDLLIPISAYYEGYNNNNEEFRNPYKSNVVNDNITLILDKHKPGGSTVFGLSIGDYIKEPTYRWIVSKLKPTRIYNGISEYEEKDYYIESWTASIKNHEDVTGIIMKDAKNLLPEENEEQKTNEFLKEDESSAGEMGDIVKYKGLYFERNNVNFLKDEDGWIKVYNDETDELLVEFGKNEYQRYDENNPYYYDKDISHIRIETSRPKIDTSLPVKHIKEINDEKLTKRYTKEEFDELKYIRGRLVAYAGLRDERIR